LISNCVIDLLSTLEMELSRSRCGPAIADPSAFGAVSDWLNLALQDSGQPG
jgi:hypothetical protein